MRRVLLLLTLSILLILTACQKDTGEVDEEGESVEVDAAVKKGDIESLKKYFMQERLVYSESTFSNLEFLLQSLEAEVDKEFLKEYFNHLLDEDITEVINFIADAIQPSTARLDEFNSLLSLYQNSGNGIGRLYDSVPELVNEVFDFYTSSNISIMDPTEHFAFEDNTFFIYGLTIGHNENIITETLGRPNEKKNDVYNYNFGDTYTVQYKVRKKQIIEIQLVVHSEEAANKINDVYKGKAYLISGGAGSSDWINYYYEKESNQVVTMNYEDKEEEFNYNLKIADSKLVSYLLNSEEVSIVTGNPLSSSINQANDFSEYDQPVTIQDALTNVQVLLTDLGWEADIELNNRKVVSEDGYDNYWIEDFIEIVVLDDEVMNVFVHAPMETRGPVEYNSMFYMIAATNLEIQDYTAADEFAKNMQDGFSYTYKGYEYVWQDNGIAITYIIGYE